MVVDGSTGRSQLVRELEGLKTEGEVVERLEAFLETLKLSGCVTNETSEEYKIVAVDLLENDLLESNKVRLLVACCLADILRLSAPEAPIDTDERKVKLADIFISQLADLKNDSDQSPFSSWRVYLLVSLTKSRVMNWLSDAEQSCDLEIRCLTVLFEVTAKLDNDRVCRLVVEMIQSLIDDLDMLPDPLLDCILENIVSPKKHQHKGSYDACAVILRRDSPLLESSLMRFLGCYFSANHLEGSSLVPKIYEVAYELSCLMPQMFAQILPSLEKKLESKDDHERMEATKLSAKLLTNQELSVAIEHQRLWEAFSTRFNDGKWQIRMKCVQYSAHFLVKQPSLRDSIEAMLIKRQHDINESVRFEVIVVVADVSRQDMSAVSDVLLNIVKERTLDTNFKIRREALLALGQIYRDHGETEDVRLGWIPNKVLHAYYRDKLEDRLIVERILYTCLVPLNLSVEEKSEKLFGLFASCDENALRALKEVFNTKFNSKCLIKKIMDMTDERSESEEYRDMIGVAAKTMIAIDEDDESDLVNFFQMVKHNPALYSHLTKLLGPPMNDVEDCVKEILKFLGSPSPTNSMFLKVKQILERIAPSLVDATSVILLLEKLNGLLHKRSKVGEDIQRLLELLLLLSCVEKSCFQSEQCLTKIYDILELRDAGSAKSKTVLLQILSKILVVVEARYPSLSGRLKSSLKDMIFNTRIPEQAKLSVKCLEAISMNPRVDFSDIIKQLVERMSCVNGIKEPILLATAWVASLCPETFETYREEVITEMVVKGILMKPRTARSKQAVPKKWCEANDLAEDVRIKLTCLKLMARWLIGLSRLNDKKEKSESLVESPEDESFMAYVEWGLHCTMTLLKTMIDRKGDLTNDGSLGKFEMAHLRLAAAKTMLKIWSVKTYTPLMEVPQLLSLQTIVRDDVEEVRQRFCLALNKRLKKMQLPVHFISLYSALGADSGELKNQVGEYVKESLRLHRGRFDRKKAACSKRSSLRAAYRYQPECAVIFSIYLLSRDPRLADARDMDSLSIIRECLWFILEHFAADEKHYSLNFFRALIRTIKRARDRLDPGNDEIHVKLFAVCDLALGLLMSRKLEYGLSEPLYPVVLPLKLFWLPTSKQPNNEKYYLPPEFSFHSQSIRSSMSKKRRKGDSMRIGDSEREMDDLTEAEEESDEPES